MSDDELRARETALGLLARREHSRAELKAKLARRGYADDVIAHTLDQLAASDLQSELRFAESFVSARAQRGRGPGRLRAELSQRGVSAEIIESALEEAAIDWLELAVKVRVKRFGDELPGDFSDRARQVRFLEYRGFSGDVIRAALRGGHNDNVS